MPYISAGGIIAQGMPAESGGRGWGKGENEARVKAIPEPSVHQSHSKSLQQLLARPSQPLQLVVGLGSKDYVESET